MQSGRAFVIAFCICAAYSTAVPQKTPKWVRTSLMNIPLEETHRPLHSIAKDSSVKTRSYSLF